MIFQRLNRSDPEKVYMAVQNKEGATVTTGRPVSLRNTSCDGITVVVANAAGDYPGFCGVAHKDIANNDYGIVTVSGWVDSILLSNAGTSVTVNALDPLIPAPAGMYSGVPTYAASGFKFVIASNVPVALSAAGYCSGVIRML